MERERWAELSEAISQVQRQVPPRPRDTHPTASIVRVHLWSVMHDRPTNWACQPVNWDDRTRPARPLPDQSTMSRRTRRADFDAFLARLGQRLNGRPVAALLKVVDGKPLELPNHSGDPDTRWGRGVSRTAVGYKLHVIWSAVNLMPEAFAVTPLDACEKRTALRMVRRVGDAGGAGYLLGDARTTTRVGCSMPVTIIVTGCCARAPSPAAAWDIVVTSRRTGCARSTNWNRRAA